MTNTGTANSSALGAAVFVIVLVGKINSGSIPIVPYYGGRKTAIGFSATDFATAGDGAAGHFMLTPGTASSTNGALIIPKGAFITAAFLKSTVTITSGGNPTYVIGFAAASIEAAARNILFTNVTMTASNDGACVLFGQQSAPNAADLARPEGAGLPLTQAASTQTVTAQHYTTDRQYVTYGININQNTEGELKIMIEYILI
jgi:hypothetical protein